MNGQWCDQAEIMESIAAWVRPRGCYELALVRPSRDYGIYRRSGAPKGMLCMGTGATRQRLCNLSPLGGARGDVIML